MERIWRDAGRTYSEETALFLRRLSGIALRHAGHSLAGVDFHGPGRRGKSFRYPGHLVALSRNHGAHAGESLTSGCLFRGTNLWVVAVHQGPEPDRFENTRRAAQAESPRHEQ